MRLTVNAFLKLFAEQIAVRHVQAPVQCRHVGVVIILWQGLPVPERVLISTQVLRCWSSSSCALPSWMNLLWMLRTSPMSRAVVNLPYSTGSRARPRAAVPTKINELYTDELFDAEFDRTSAQ